MSKHEGPKKHRRRTIEFQVTDEVAAVLDELVGTGFFGANPDEVASRLLNEKLREVAMPLVMNKLMRKLLPPIPMQPPGPFPASAPRPPFRRPDGSH